MMSDEKPVIDGTYSPVIKCRWKNYSNYKLLLMAWMMNEASAIFSPPSISHTGFYVHVFLQTLAVLFIGMPLVYSEICLAQYTNCNIFTMWNYFPFFRNVGYGTFYLIILKTLYILVLTSWYLVYTFYSGLDVPPWLSCDDFTNSKCMVKRVNISLFQHCLEAQILFNTCEVSTASKCFFEREIGNNCTAHTLHCFYPWKTIAAVAFVCISIYLLSIKKEKLIQVIVKFEIFYISFVILILFCVAMSTSGTWYASKTMFHWNHYDFQNCFESITRGFLSVGTGYGIIVHLTRDVPFRSPATMTSICTTLFTVFTSLMLGLIAFSGVKTMSYYHGEEENVMEIGYSIYFLSFASMSEIMTYFDAKPIWGFFWFSMIFICLYVNFWLLYLFLRELVLDMETARNYSKLSCMFLIMIIVCATLPFLCSDLTVVLTDATETIQIFQSLLFSISLYWIYGFNNHNVDIIFMIGIKANYFWKLVWLVNPIFLSIILYEKLRNLLIFDNYWFNEDDKYRNSYFIESIGMDLDSLLLIILMSIYLVIIIVGLLMQIKAYYHRKKLRNILSPSRNWGPKDKILFKSRKMFVPEIMTREFLYRQVRIRGYNSNSKTKKQKENRQHAEETFSEMNWSALTSN